MKRIIALSAVAFLSTAAFSATPAEMEAKINALEAKIAKFEKLEAKLVEMEARQAKLVKMATSKAEAKKLEEPKAKIAKAPAKDKEFEALKKKVAKIEKTQKKTKKTLAKVKAHDAFDNIKFNIDFRNGVESVNYKDNKNNLTARNNSLFTSRLHLNMKSSPIDNVTFSGKLAIYSTWGSHLYVDDAPLKDWSASSKPSDTVMRIKEAFFVYSDDMGDQPYKISIGRRPSSTGFLANYRENEKTSGSPLAHITNMEVNAAMLQFDFSRFIEGAYTKIVYGRAHDGEGNNVYGTESKPWKGTPYADTSTYLEDKNVDFLVILGDAYNNGQHQLMYEWAHIFNTKGKSTEEVYPPGHANAGDPVIKGAAGVADLFALSYKIDGVGDEISDFLDETTLFASVAATQYSPKSGHSILGSTSQETGQSIWVGAIIPDMMTEDGKLGFEFNYGSKYWTPMTWAEDTAIGSKIAVRGKAYEAYWNFNFMGVKYLPSQIRYTYAQHDYTPNANCNGWTAVESTDITAQDIRFFIAYRY